LLSGIDDEQDFDVSSHYYDEPEEEPNIDESSKLAELEAVLNEFEDRYTGGDIEEPEEDQFDKEEQFTEDDFEAEAGDDSAGEEMVSQEPFDEDADNQLVDDTEPSLDELDFGRDLEWIGDDNDELFTGEPLDGGDISGVAGPGRVVDKVREMESDHWNLREEERKAAEEFLSQEDDATAEESFAVPESDAEPEDEFQAEESDQDDLLDFNVEELLVPRDEGGRTDIISQEEQVVSGTDDFNTIDFEIFSESASEEEPFEADIESADDDLDSMLDDFSEASEEDIDLLSGSSDAPADEEDVDLLADFDAGSEAGAAGSTVEAASDDVDTMIDLAKVFITMGDTDGAKEMLEEALEKGSALQKNVISELIEQLG
jgi:pilus assembly protein FimV